MEKRRCVALTLIVLVSSALWPLPSDDLATSAESIRTSVPRPLNDEGLGTTDDPQELMEITIAEARNALYSHRVRLFYEGTTLPAWSAFAQTAIATVSTLETETAQLRTTRDIWRTSTITLGIGLAVSLILMAVIP